MDCARSIVQAGIVKVITRRPEFEFANRWREHIERSMRLFRECGVEVEFVE